jgi:hypothetical protein
MILEPPKWSYGLTIKATIKEVYRLGVAHIELRNNFFPTGAA